MSKKWNSVHGRIRLTDVEISLMECLWNSENSLSFQDLLNCMSKKFGKVWRNQTLRTCLKSLRKSGLVKSNSWWQPSLYHANCTKEEFLQHQAAHLQEKEFDSPVKKFLATFVGGNPLSEKEIEKLAAFLEDPDQEHSSD